jgi:hypothetical protein
VIAAGIRDYGMYAEASEEFRMAKSAYGEVVVKF